MIHLFVVISLSHIISPYIIKPMFRYYKTFVETGAKRLGLGARVLDMEEESPVGWQRVTDIGATEKEYFFNSFEHNTGGLGCYWHDLFSAVRTVRLLDHHTTHYDIFNDTSFRRAMRQWRRNAQRRSRHQLLKYIDHSVCMLEGGGIMQPLTASYSLLQPLTASYSLLQPAYSLV